MTLQSGELPYKKTLIEGALPSGETNRESACERPIRHGHPAMLHLWWTRRPLVTSRTAVLGLSSRPISHERCSSGRSDSASPAPTLSRSVA